MRSYLPHGNAIRCYERSATFQMEWHGSATSRQNNYVVIRVGATAMIAVAARFIVPVAQFVMHGSILHRSTGPCSAATSLRQPGTPRTAPRSGLDGPDSRAPGPRPLCKALHKHQAPQAQDNRQERRHACSRSENQWEECLRPGAARSSSRKRSFPWGRRR